MLYIYIDVCSVDAWLPVSFGACIQIQWDNPSGQGLCIWAHSEWFILAFKWSMFGAGVWHGVSRLGHLWVVMCACTKGVWDAGWPVKHVGDTPCVRHVRKARFLQVLLQRRGLQDGKSNHRIFGVVYTIHIYIYIYICMYECIWREIEREREREGENAHSIYISSHESGHIQW